MGWGYQPERVQAGNYLLFYMLLASLPLLVDILFAYNSLGSLCLFILCWNGSLVGGSNVSDTEKRQTLNHHIMIKFKYVTQAGIKTPRSELAKIENYIWDKKECPQNLRLFL